MASEPRLGTKIRRAIERRRMTQQQVADALGVSRSAVNAWVNGRAVPMNAIGALEALLDANLTEQDRGEVYTDPDELAIWSITTLPEDERRHLIGELRDRRRQHARRTEIPPA